MYPSGSKQEINEAFGFGFDASKRPFRPIKKPERWAITKPERRRSSYPTDQLIKRSGAGFDMFPAVLLELKTQTVFD